MSAQKIDLECRLASQTYAILKAEPDDKLAIEKIKKMRHRLNPDGELSGPDKDVDTQLTMLTSPWYRYFIGYDPRPTLSKVQCPVLAINGDHDAQVPATENLAAITKAFEASGNKKLTVVKLTGLNHLFQTCTTGLPQEYATIEETISPKALTIIGDWIAKQTNSCDSKTK